MGHQPRVPVTHPSLPNYLALAGGSTFGVSDDRSPSSHPITQDSVFDAVIAAGHRAKIYAEAMPEPCTLGPTGRYAVKHNPWAYFSSDTSRDNCRRLDVPALQTLIATAPGPPAPTVRLLLDSCLAAA